MQEFKLVRHSESEPMAALSRQELKKYLERVMVYMEDPVITGRLKNTQPMEQESAMGAKGKFKDGPFNESKEVILGYYPILCPG